jgi:hypothetical protein
VAQDYLGEVRRFYVPSDQGLEVSLKERLQRRRTGTPQAPSPHEPDLPQGQTLLAP